MSGMQKNMLLHSRTINLGATIRLELGKIQSQTLTGASSIVYVQMPNEQFKNLNLTKGDHVLLQRWIQLTSAINL